MMSWSFHLQNINRSFERIAAWYSEFMRRTELCFQSFHERIVHLEEQQAWQGPTDEQVERVLRKILAERFSDSGLPRAERRVPTSDGNYFVENPKELAFPKPIQIDPACLLVEPESVPSKVYAETFQMLESSLAHFTRDLNPSVQDNSKDIKMNIGDKKFRCSDNV